MPETPGQPNIGGLAPAASKPSLAALSADSPFARLDRFEDSQVREHAPFRPAPDFNA